jgi:hypothetical protein
MTTISAPLRADPMLRDGTMSKRRKNASGLNSLSLLVTLAAGLGVNVRDIGSNTRSTSNVVQAQGGDGRISLQEQRQRLSDTSSGTEDGDLALRSGGGGECSSGEGSCGGGSGEHFWDVV